MPTNGLNGLTDEQVHRIRSERRPDEYYAKLYGQCQGSIANARRGRTYKWHPTPPYRIDPPAIGRHASGESAAAPSRPAGVEPIDGALFDRLVAWVEVDAAGCWIWTGAYHSSTSHPSGHHGHIAVDGKGTSTHRAMWRAIHGTIPDGMHVLHRCDKPKCIHPAHLWLGTHADNMRDSKLKGRHAMSNKKLCNRGHELPPADLSGKRRCKKCLVINSQNYYARKKAEEDRA